MATRHGRNKGPRKSALLKRFSATMVHVKRTPNVTIVEQHNARAASLRVPHSEVAAELAKSRGGYPREEMAARVLADAAKFNVHNGVFEGRVQLMSLILEDLPIERTTLFHGGGMYVFVLWDKHKQTKTHSFPYYSRARAMTAFSLRNVRFDLKSTKKVIDLER